MSELLPCLPGEWHPIPGWTAYLVSDDGIVRHVKRTPKAIQWRKDGYGQVVLEGPKRRRAMVAHLVLEAFVGPRPKGCECRHLNGNRGDNRLMNLAWGTPKENGEDNVRLGAQPRGEKHGSSRFSENDVKRMRLLYAHGYTMQSIADEFRTDSGTISKVVNRQRWAHV